MAEARPGGAVEPARSRLADRDEFPELGGGNPLAPSTDPGVAPAPWVHLRRSPVMVAAMPLPPIEPTQWRPVDPQNAREALRVEREVDIPQGRRTRRPRPAQLSSGDATERMTRLAQVDGRRRAFMVAATIFVVVGLGGTIWRFANESYAAAQPSTTWDQVSLPGSTAGTSGASPAVPTPAAPRTSASTSVAALPSEAVITAEATQVVQATASAVPAILTSNAIYASAITGSCPDQGKPADVDAAVTALTAYVACMNQVWEPIVGAGHGVRFRPASIYFYVNTTMNGCATLHVSDPIAAMYCPMDATIYVSPTGVANAVGDRYYEAELVTHEYVHHVQSLTQILTAVSHESWSDNEKSRRIQLQAHCLSFALLTHVDGFSPQLATFRLGWRVGPGTATYGSVSSLQHWGEKGISATRVGDCETYSVASSVVS